MPALSSIADLVTLTLPTFERNKWDSVGLAQLYPRYESVRQFVQGARRKRDTSFLLRRELEIGAPTSYEHSFTNHPAETSTHQLAKEIETPMVKVRTSMTFSEDEKALQGKSMEEIVDVVQMRTVKWQRDLWEGLEHDLLRFPSSPTQFPDQLRGIPYWVTDNTAVTDFDMNGGSDPTGHPDGAGGITSADEPNWPNAVAEFSTITQDDVIDKIERFLNLVKMMSVVPHPTTTPDVPDRVLYVNEPIKRGFSRYFSGANENVGVDAGVYRGDQVYKLIPITIWHAANSDDSPVQDSTGTIRLIDWNTFSLTVHSKFDQKIIGPTELPNVPGQIVVYNLTWWALECSRRDRNMIMTTSNAEFAPAS